MHPLEELYGGRGLLASGHENIAPVMAEHHRKPRSGNRHVHPARSWNPEKALYEEAKAAIKEGLSWTVVDWLTECLKYVVGRRKSFPPRPQWAEERAAALPDGDPDQPDGTTDT
jgi:hypothetical protein